MEVKNSMSHRARALAQVVEWMKERRGLRFFPGAWRGGEVSPA